MTRHAWAAAAAATAALLAGCADTRTLHPTPTTTTTAPPTSVATTTTVSVSDPGPATVAPFTNCDEAHAAGAAPLRPGDPGWSDRLDGDGDGTACEG